ncbi:HAD-IIA family hydrolase [Sporomusa sphaeroides DSM 2875]|uniref:HAD-IIA family hydrolase n=1 Tax=Sporomusa sphaeroides TaxID=47679 RepID=UPI0020308E08|nr:HAD-IIA family hydrolase [Sporomusa sphaeroides]MCM0760973.1 HAD-IIA family hydrolase [Sporomusa sphaeroides DSM 2875]
MLAERYDVFLIDLDGVMYVGDELLPGSREAVEALRRMGKQIYFLTNDPRYLRREFCEKLLRLGVSAQEEEFITPGWTAAHYLARHGIRRVQVIGTASLRAEFANQGIQAVTTGECQAVVVGYDEHATLTEVEQAVRQIEEGALFIATNPDLSFPGKDGRQLATGAIVQAIQAASRRVPVIIGKPYPPMFQQALYKAGNSSRTVMIGDSPDTDILGAHQCGLDAILVERTACRYPAASDYRLPNARITTLLELFQDSSDFREWRDPGFPWPDTIEPGVTAVIFNSQGEVLLVERVDNGLWGLPSGHVEKAETVTQAIVREIREETGLGVAVEKLVGVYSEPATQVFSYPSGKHTHFITLCFRCSITGGRLRADNNEISRAAFFAVDELPANLLPMHPQWLKDALDKAAAAVIR